MSSIIGQFSSSFGRVGTAFKNGNGDVDVNAMVLMAVALLIIAAPLELGQLAFALVGSLCYAAVQASRKATQKTLKPKKKLDDDYASYKPRVMAKAAPAIARAKPDSTRPEKVDKNPAGKLEYRQVSSQPVVARTFEAGDFTSQVQELLRDISPSAEGDMLVKAITAVVKKGLSKLIPEAEVMGFASGDVLRGTAFAVAIPEVDIILSASPSIFVERLQTRAARPLPHAAKLDAKKLQKSMLRACTDELTLVPNFKFRRSAFKGQEPKVTLMAEVNGRTIPIDFSVNTITPLHNVALLTECGQIEPKAKELILLVRRWAKDRGIAHAAKGHLSPYSWTLLSIYFLQVWEDQGKLLLPNITSFKLSSGLLRKQHQEQQGTRAPAAEAATDLSVAQLFKAFISFYVETFNWRNEAVSVRVGKRQPPAMSLPLHIVTTENGAEHVAISVENPFEPKRNLGDGMTGVTLRRLREELCRAHSLFSSQASLSQLIEPWVPPEYEATQAVEEDETSS